MTKDKPDIQPKIATPHPSLLALAREMEASRCTAFEIRRPQSLTDFYIESDREQARNLTDTFHFVISKVRTRPY